MAKSRLIKNSADPHLRLGHRHFWSCTHLEAPIEVRSKLASSLYSPFSPQPFEKRSKMSMIQKRLKHKAAP